MVRIKQSKHKSFKTYLYSKWLPPFINKNNNHFVKHKKNKFEIVYTTYILMNLKNNNISYI